MNKRTYAQRCAIARSLDVLGERWTLLLIRELLIGPRRFKDLMAGLPGIGTNILADRVKLLQDEGIIRPITLPPPAGVSAYELTDKGRALEPALLALANWGWTHLDSSPDAVHSRPTWTVVALRGLFNPEAARGLRETYEFRIDDDVFFARVADGQLETGLGPATDPVLIVTADEESFLALASGEGPTALASGRVRVEGSDEALQRCADVFSGSRGP